MRFSRIVPALAAAWVLTGEACYAEQAARHVRAWFLDADARMAPYLRWMTTDPNGIDEREAKNNHGTCWVMQVAAFARLTGNGKLLAFCRDRFRTVLVPNHLWVGAAPDSR